MERREPPAAARQKCLMCSRGWHMKGGARSLIWGAGAPGWLWETTRVPWGVWIHPPPSPPPSILKHHRGKINPLQTAPLGGACSTIYTFIAPPGFMEEVFSWKHQCGVALMQPPSSEVSEPWGVGTSQIQVIQAPFRANSVLRPCWRFQHWLGDFFPPGSPTRSRENAFLRENSVKCPQQTQQGFARSF